MVDLKSTAFITAGFGSITLFWNYIRGIFSRLSSILVVSVELQGDLGGPFVRYCWDNFKCSKIGDRRFAAHHRFIRPKDRIGLVAMELTGKNLTFWSKHKPLFVSCGVDKNGSSDGTVKVSFIRYTFEIEELLLKSCNETNERNHSENKKSSRYRVVNFFGKNKNGSKETSGDAPSSKGSVIESDENSSAVECKPIGWKKDELGAQVSKAPFKNLSYSNSVKEFETEIRRWKESEKWFKEKGLPWRFGGGLFGPPGTGKSSFVKAVAQDLDMPIHKYDLSTMNNEELVTYWHISLSQSPCIVLFEDLDRLFDKDKNIKSTKNNQGITLDCLLNCISGVEASDGILILITANDPKKLDSALGVPDSNGESSRPGRLDRAVYFGVLSESGRLEIASRILTDCSHYIKETIKDGQGETGAQFESRCSKIALREYWGGFKLYKESEEAIEPIKEELHGEA